MAGFLHARWAQTDAENGCARDKGSSGLVGSAFGSVDIQAADDIVEIGPQDTVSNDVRIERGTAFPLVFRSTIGGDFQFDQSRAAAKKMRAEASFVVDASMSASRAETHE